MSVVPRREYGDWKPGHRGLRALASAVGVVAFLIAAFVFSGVFGGGTGAPSGEGRPRLPGADERTSGGSVIDLSLPAARQLEALRIRHRKEAPAYDRSFFGEAWADVDNNGCDTRNDVLSRDLDSVRYRRGSRCVVNEGVLHDPYAGETIHFKRGPDTSPLVQIDHVVALGDAWRSGAWEWSDAERQEFANDPDNLLAVQGQANQDKESSRADQWLPPRREYWCEYVTRQIRVKYEWDLSVTPREREAMMGALATCPTN